MQLLALLIICLPCLHAASLFPTKYFREYAPNVLYARNTYLPNTGYDACAPINDNAYIPVLTARGIKCTGIWCVDGHFGCPNRTKDCYNMNYIIDVSHSNNDCNLQIAGNVIMAYGNWVSTLGPLSWQNVREEKIKVYGSIFNEAVRNVMNCSPGCSFSDETPIMYYLYQLKIDSITTLALVVTITVTYLVIAICLLCTACMWYRRVRRLQTYYTAESDDTSIDYV